MTNPVSKSNKVQFTGYAGAQAGLVRNVSNEIYANAGAMLGGEINYKGTFLRAQIGRGTATSKSVELGHTFDIGRNMGLELSAKAQDSRSLIAKGDACATINSKAQGTVTDKNKETGENAQVLYNYSDSAKIKTKWSMADSRLGGQAKLTFGSSTARFGVGVEAGIHYDNKPTVGYNYSSNYTLDADIYGEKKTIQFQSKADGTLVENTTKGYVTPAVSADIKLNKHLSFNANADLYQAQAGIRYNF